MAYGVGELKPSEFWDMTPGEFNPYIEARIKAKKDEMKMINDRIGLIASILHNGIPVFRVKGEIKAPKKKYSPSDYFREDKPHDDIQVNDSEKRTQEMNHINSVMQSWVKASSRSG